MSADVQQFQVDLRGVVDLLSRHIYSSPRVYLRELLQNARDAITCLLYTSPSPRDRQKSRMPSSA